MTRHRGFTLLELLIGLALLGFVLALLLSGFRLASDSWDGVTTRAERTTNALIGRNLVRRTLTQAQAIRWIKAVGQPVTFVADGGVIHAVAPLPGPAGTGGLRVIELSIADAPGAGGIGKRQLLLRQVPLRYDAERFDEDLGSAEPHVLIDRLERAEFSYFGPSQPNEESSWQDTWSNPEQLPRLIRLRLNGDLDNAADLLVAPIIGTTGFCLWDSLLQRCK